MKEYEWKKTLFKAPGSGGGRDTPGDDSYTDEKTFLSGLVKNAHFRKYRFWDAFWQSLVVTKEVSTVQAFISVFSSALYGPITAATLIAIDVVMYSISVLWILRSRRLRRKKREQEERGDVPREGEVDLKTLLILIACAYGLSPVLSTLTSSFSSDSIYWSTGLLLVAHLYSYSYCPLGEQEWAEAPGVQSPVSLNAAIFASVLLASRLPTAAYVFGFANYALLLFVLLPHIKFTASVASTPGEGPEGGAGSECGGRGKEEKGEENRGDEKGKSKGKKDLLHEAKKRYFVINVALFVCNVVMMRQISVAIIWIYVSLLLFISVLCPLILLFIQKYKRYSISIPSF